MRKLQKLSGPTLAIMIPGQHTQLPHTSSYPLPGRGPCQTLSASPGGKAESINLDSAFPAAIDRGDVEGTLQSAGGLSGAVRKAEGEIDRRIASWDA
jgi:hypothetical protein